MMSIEYVMLGRGRPLILEKLVLCVAILLQHQFNSYVCMMCYVIAKDYFFFLL